MKPKIILWILLVLLTIYSANALDLTNNMVHYYTFDTANSSNPGGNPTMTDWFKTANVTSSVNNPVWNITGQNLEAWNYTAIEEYSVINNDVQIDAGNINTWCGWFKMPSNKCIDAQHCQIIYADDNRCAWSIRIEADDEFNFHYSSSGVDGDLTWHVALNGSQWYHFCTVYNSTQVNEMEIYINGVQRATGNKGDALDQKVGRQRFAINTAGNRRYRGLLDEMMFYSDAKSPAFISALYNETSIGNYTWIKNPPTPPPSASIIVSYTSPVYEDNNVIHTILFKNYNITNLTTTMLHYNGSNYAGVINWTNASYVLFTTNLITPIVYLNNTQMPFYWNYHLNYVSGSNATNSTINYNQSILWNLTKYPRTNITAFTVAGNPILNFTLNSSERSYTTTTGEIYFRTDATKTLNISIDATGYALSWALINFTSGSFGSFNYTLWTTNSIFFTFRDEETHAIINNISIELISSVFSNNYTTNNGTLYVDLLSPTLYTMRYTCTDGGYFERFYYFNLLNRTFTNLTLYLLSNTTGTEVTATVYDESNFLVEGAYIKVLRYDLASNSYILQEIAQATNFEGVTKLHLILNDEFYQFYIEYPFSTLLKVTNPTYIYENSLTFQIVTGSQVGERFFKSQNITYDLSFNNATNNFRFIYSDANNIVSKGCLKIWRISPTNKILYNSSCVNSPSSTILLSVTNTSGFTYEAKAYVYFSEPAYYLTSLSHSFDVGAIAGVYGMFLIIILTVTFMMVGYWSKTLALILSPLPLMMGSILNIIDISMGICISIEIICVIVAYWISRR